MALNVWRAAFVAMSLCALAGCSSTRVEPIAAADENWITDVRVAAIHVEKGNPDIPAAVLANLSTHLRTVMDECVTGQRPIDLRVRIDNFEGNSAIGAILIGDTIGISGTAMIENPETGGVEGEYYIDSMQAGGGIIGAIALAGAESDMPLLFAEQLCEEVFAGQIAEVERTETPGASSVQTPDGSTEDAEGGLRTDAWGTSVDEVGAAGTSTSSIYQAPVQYNPETE